MKRREPVFSEGQGEAQMGRLVQQSNAVLRLGRLSLQFGRVNRITFHEDGVTPESDTDHTVMLGLVACAFAARYIPRLDVGRVAQYCLVHDLVEVEAGDTPTLRQLSLEEKQDKEDRESKAFVHIAEQFYNDLPWVPETLRSYNEQRDPESRYVRAIDKLTPKITHLLNGCRALHVQGVRRGAHHERLLSQLEEIRSYASDFPELINLHEFMLELLYRVAPP